MCVSHYIKRTRVSNQVFIATNINKIIIIKKKIILFFQIFKKKLETNYILGGENLRFGLWVCEFMSLWVCEFVKQL